MLSFMSIATVFDQIGLEKLELQSVYGEESRENDGNDDLLSQSVSTQITCPKEPPNRFFQAFVDEQTCLNVPFILSSLMKTIWLMFSTMMKTMNLSHRVPMDIIIINSSLR